MKQTVVKLEDHQVFEPYLNSVAILHEDFSERKSGLLKDILKIPSLKNSPLYTELPWQINIYGEEYFNEYRKRWCFKNHYGISIVRGFGTDGVADGKFEIGLIKWNVKPEDGKLFYDSGIFSDVIGHLTAVEVLEHCKKILQK